MIQTHLIIGRLGSGKSSLIQHLIESKPDNESWAIVVNEFGQVGIDAALLSTTDTKNTQITEIAGGCICCAAQSQLRVQLTALIRQHKPQRIIIEATGLGHPAGIVDLLRDTSFKDIIDLKSILAVIDLSLFNPTYDKTDQRSPINTAAFIQHANLADIIVFNKQDLASELATQQANNYFRQIYPEKVKFIKTTHGQVNSDLLTIKTDKTSTALFRQVINNTLQTESDEIDFRRSTIKRYISTDNEILSFGYLLPAEFSFKRKAVTDFFNQIMAQCKPSLIRIKAVINTGKFWHSFNAIDQQIDIQESFYRRDNRIEIITENHDIDINDITEELLDCIR